MNEARRVIERQRTALSRSDLSRPMRRALQDGLINSGVSVFDYGCGRGGDIEHLSQAGVTCSGWDPAFRPSEKQKPANVVNLGYVINVIENPEERARTLRSSWELAEQVLVVSAQVEVSSRGRTAVPFGDGFVTDRNTFQKFFEQGELKDYIENTLGTEALPAEPGIFYVFRDEGAREQFAASRYRRRSAAPRKRQSEVLYEENRELLDAFMEALASYGRVPDAEEWPRTTEIEERFGSSNRAFALVRRITGPEEWEQIAARRREDISVFLALSRFRKRPTFSNLPRTLRNDIKEFFGTYTKACAESDVLLFRAGDTDSVNEACQASSLGKLLPNALYIHQTALESLGALLRVYEGCAKAYLGAIDGTTLIKLHRFSGKVSYLSYPDFERDPHPALARSVKLNLRTRQTEYLNYSESENPPILHRKETFLAPDDPLREKYAELTQKEEKAGLLEETATIGTRNGWNLRLAEKGYAFRGHRLIRRK